MDNSTPPQTTNPFATAVNRILSALIEGAAEDEVLVLIYATAPTFFAIPIIGWIAKGVVKFVVSNIGTYFYQVTAKIVAKIIVNVQAQGENSKVKEKGSALEDALNKGDADAIAKADQEYQDALGDLIHSDGAAPP